MARRTLADWLEWQERLHPVEIELGLDRVRAVLADMGLARPSCTIVTVGGTNGKGSCVAVLEALGLKAGRRVGAYTSPHLRRYNERIRVDGREVEDDELVNAFEAVESARGRTSLSYFEYGTVAALEIFRRRGVDLAVLEVGLGGRLDAVNAVEPQAAVVTSVGLDHLDWLGPDRESIGREKGGIFRPGRPAVIGDRRPPASLLEAAAGDALRLGIDFDWIDEHAGWSWKRANRVLRGLPRGALAAPALCDNAACALAAFDALWPLESAETVREALAGVRLPGRLQRVPGEVEWWFDVAHNPDGAAVLAGALAAAPATGRTVAVLGMLAEKDAAGVAAALERCVDRWFAASLPPPRGLSAEALAASIAPYVHGTVSACASVEAACRRARDQADPGDRIVVFGSFHTVGPALGWLELYCAPQTR